MLTQVRHFPGQVPWYVRIAMRWPWILALFGREIEHRRHSFRDTWRIVKKGRECE